MAHVGFVVEIFGLVLSSDPSSCSWNAGDTGRKVYFKTADGFVRGKARLARLSRQTDGPPREADIRGDSAAGEEQPNITFRWPLPNHIEPGTPEHVTQLDDGKTLKARDSGPLGQNLVGVVIVAELVELTNDLIDHMNI